MPIIPAESRGLGACKEAQHQPASPAAAARSRAALLRAGCGWQGVGVRVSEHSPKHRARIGAEGNTISTMAGKGFERDQMGFLSVGTSRF